MGTGSTEEEEERGKRKKKRKGRVITCHARGFKWKGTRLGQEKRKGKSWAVQMRPTREGKERERKRKEQWAVLIRPSRRG